MSPPLPHPPAPGPPRSQTIGDAYLCCTNLNGSQQHNHAAAMARFSVAAMRAARETAVDPDDPRLGHVHMRIGIHSGPCMASLVGKRNPKYTLMGDTINVASRMESSGAPNWIQCSRRTADLIRVQDPAIVLARRGEVQVRGGGACGGFRGHWARV